MSAAGGMKVIMTGATGYIGAQLTRRLVGDGHVVHAVVRESSDTTKLRKLGDHVHLHAVAADQSQLCALMADVRPAVVYHFAGYGAALHSDIGELIDANIGAGLRLIEAMARTGVRRFVNASSYWQFDSEGEVAPNGLYAASKQAFREHLASYEEDGTLETVHLILYSIYGPGDWRRKLMTDLFAARGGPLELTGGDQYLDYVYIDDVIDAFSCAATQLIERPEDVRNQMFTVGTGKLTTAHQLIALFEEVSGGAVDARWGARPYLPGQIFEPMRPDKPLPGWHSSVDLRAGLEKIIQIDQYSGSARVVEN
ncbi:MAG: NAD-dependent epimerase/dehydratase [Rhodospirillaceae bacterium]|nr:NAD-dependent epimerase/dehydratase [Rhodospirillaceae bacterium]